MKRWIARNFSISTIFFLIFGLIGFIFLVVGLLVSVGTARFRERAVETTAVITSIDEYYDSSDDDYSHTVWVRYYVRDEPVETVLREYSSNMYEGMEIPVYYDPENPRRVEGELSGMVGTIFAVIGGVFFAGTLVGLIITWGRRRGNERLMRTGRKEYVPVSEVLTAHNITVNGRHPYQIACDWTDPISGRQFQFKSGYLREDPAQILERRRITVLPVYMDEKKPGRYFMDLSDLEENSTFLTEFTE